MKIPHSIITGAALLAAAALAGAPAWAAESKSPNSDQKGSSVMEKTKEKTKSTAQEAKGMVTDSWVTSKVKIALFADDRVKGRQIKVETTKGVVTLRGKVDSDEAKSAAADVAKGIDHVKSVKNDLEVVAPAEQKAVSANDKEITGHVQQRLKRDPSLKSVKVRTDGGVVTLTGNAPSLSASAHASELAREVPGVTSVRNELSLKSASTKSSSMRPRSDQSARAHEPVAGSSAPQEQVKAAQDSLKRQGYDPGPTDGIMGPRTAAALKNFQRDKGLTMTGEADAATMSKLGIEGAMLSQKQSP
ncbi:MAG TPA: BON domain-containing protein [Methylomirabilota bacterium]|nr:BON domain-containing protein [Methylomirabilota bacterium]